jgi:Sec-independent protein translocase protein TatA
MKFAGLPAIALGLAALPAQAQDAGAALQAFRREMDEMRRLYDSQIETLRREHEAKMRAMESRLKAAEDAAAEAASTPPVAAAAGAPASESAFNPSIGVVLNGTFGAFTRNPDKYRIPGFALGEETGPGVRGFSLGESEITFSANIDHVLFGNLTISHPGGTEVELEEAFIQTTALPYGFTVKGGRFFSGIGYLNGQHAHTWDFADAPLPYRAMLANQYRDDGVQVRWLAPTDFFLEFGAEAFRGDSFPAGGARRNGVGAFSAFVHAGDDIGVESSWRAGASFLSTKARDRETGELPDLFTGKSNIAILDAVYKWAPDGNPTDRNFKLQGEYFFRREDGDFNGIAYVGTQQGFYVQGIYQFMPQWRTGLRYDRLWSSGVCPALAGTVLDNEGHVARRFSSMLEYNTSEFGRFRAQYNLDRSQPGKIDHQGLLQYTVNIGAHGAHLF